MPEKNELEVLEEISKNSRTIKLHIIIFASRGREEVTIDQSTIGNLKITTGEIKKPILFK
ncbi:MAG: hypothetical protein HeimC3_08420 [Candidatus Heimdallarchaeota archaeon LC_3]|nr:MAG: hypothetical protein HeimC3_08420 [Candidatus Heimdallarchaeota archaeon LC_3]